jgi:hypothetical protein
VEKGSNPIINAEDFIIAWKKPTGNPKPHLFTSDGKSGFSIVIH